MGPVEFLVKTQYFIKIKPFKQRIIDFCKDMQWVPNYMLQRLIDWVNSIEWDWLISRQRVYGTPIPFWHCRSCDQIIPPKREQLPVVPESDEPPVDSCPNCGSTDIAPSLDVCDCWVDSSITPLVITGYFNDEELFKRAYPTSIRQQGHDIIRTWLYYTVLRCVFETDTAPFREVLINGHILSPDGHKMSKSLGNVVSPEDRLEEFGADSLRQSLLSLTVGSDFPFGWEVVKYSKSFLQKYWSVSRFAYQFIQEYVPSLKDVEYLTVVDKWILAKLVDTIKQVTEALDNYAFHSALNALQNFVWHDFCDQYIEAVKYRLYERSNERSCRAAQYTLYTILRNSSVILSPICPHITEEIYHILFKDAQATIHAEDWPHVEGIPLDAQARGEGNTIMGMIANIRSEKAKHGIPLNANIDKVVIVIPKTDIAILRKVVEDIKRILKIKHIVFEDGERSEVKILTN